MERSSKSTLAGTRLDWHGQLRLGNWWVPESKQLEDGSRPLRSMLLLVSKSVQISPSSSSSPKYRKGWREWKPDSQIHCSLMGHLSLSCKNTNLPRGRQWANFVSASEAKWNMPVPNTLLCQTTARIDVMKEIKRGRGCRSWRDKYFSSAKGNFSPSSYPPSLH